MGGLVCFRFRAFQRHQGGDHAQKQRAGPGGSDTRAAGAVRLHDPIAQSDAEQPREDVVMRESTAGWTPVRARPFDALNTKFTRAAGGAVVLQEVGSGTDSDYKYGWMT